MTMKAGKYFIGDLCYVMHPEWDEVCDLMFPGRGGEVEGEMTLKDGRKFATFGTAYGDGEYQSNIGTSHGVDSGSIGCILVEDIKDDTYDDLEEHGAIVEFTQPFEVRKENNSMLIFGHIRINTDWDDNGEDE